MTIDIAKLKAAALAATPGPWSYNGNCRFGVWQNAEKFYVFETGSHADAVFTALANPDVILQLVTELETLRSSARSPK